MKLPKLYRLARSPLSQHDLERPKIAQFLLLCPALFYIALRHHEKVEGHSKKKLDGHGRARREAARRRKSERKINFRKTKFLLQ